MPRGKTAKPTPGQHVKVTDGVTMPEFPDLAISGWTGKVMETTGSGAKMKVILEWDAATLPSIPDSYRQQCEAQGLLYSMACLPAADIEAAE